MPAAIPDELSHNVERQSLCRDNDVGLVLAIAVIEQQHGAALLHGRPCRIDACFELRGGSTYEGLKHPLAKKW